MGSGISLNKNQIITIIKRNMIDEFELIENTKPKYTYDGYEIYYDFTNEYNLTQKIKMLDKIQKNLRVQ